MLDHEGQAGTAQNQTQPVEFKFENHAVRTIMAGDEIQFVAADVCEVLGIKNPTDAIGRLDDDEKALAFIEGIPGGQRINVVNQFGLTRLISEATSQRRSNFNAGSSTRFCHRSIKLAGPTTSKTRLHQDWRPLTTMFLCACRGRQLLLPSHTISSP